MCQYSATALDTTEIKEVEIEVLQERLPHTIKDGDDFDVSWKRTCGNVELMKMTNSERDEELEH